MAKKITLADIAKILKKDKTKGDTSYWGVVQSVNKTNGKVTSYDVSLGGSTGTVKCRKLAGAEVGNTVLVTLRSTGEAVVVGTKNGDKDALDAPVTFTTSTVTPPYKKGDMWIYSDFKKVCVTTKTASQSYSASDWEDIGGTGEQNNYFWYDSEGAHVSLLERVVTGVKNVLVDSNGFYIRNGTDNLATFTANQVELGKGNSSAVIKMCDDSIKIGKSSDDNSFRISNSTPITDANRNGVWVSATRTGQTYPFAYFNAGTDNNTRAIAEIRATQSANNQPYISLIAYESGNSAVGIWGDTINVKGSTLADFVTEEGTDTVSGFEYRKWRSGKKECWKKTSQQISVTSGSSKPYYGDGSVVAFPTGFFSSTPMVQMDQIGSAGGWLGVADNSAATSSVTAKPRFYRLSSSSSVTITLSIYAIGS